MVNSVLNARVSLAVEFPQKFILENFVLRSDNSMLVTVVTRKELYYVPPLRAGVDVTPLLIHTFDEDVTGITEVQADVFVVFTGNVYTTHETYMHRFDLRDWKPGMPVDVQRVLEFPKAVLAPNGCCALDERTVLVAETLTGSIWRVDFDDNGAPSTSLWLQHESMAHIPDTLPWPPQPGINGLRYSSKRRAIYYTTCGQKLFMRVAIDPTTFEPAGAPEQLSGGGMYDDFCIDDERGVAYVTVHRENRIDRIALDAKSEPEPIAGVPFDPMLLGPTSAAWSRLAGEERRVVYVTTDGGATAPPPDGLRTAKVLRMELTSET